MVVVMVRVSFVWWCGLSQALTTKITHCVAAGTGHFVAAAFFNERKVAFGADALAGGGFGGFDACA